MNYTDLEKLAIIKVLFDMMVADGNIDSKESAYLDYVKRLIGMPMAVSGQSISFENAVGVISKMNDDKKIEVSYMLHYMMMADGIRDKREQGFFDKVMISTGIDKVWRMQAAQYPMMFDDAKIYLQSSKKALANRSSNFLAMIDNNAKYFRKIFGESVTTEDICNAILEHTKQDLRFYKWEDDDVNGVTWCIANLTDTMLKAGIIKDFDDVFVRCFRKYFNLITIPKIL